jgi:predicted MFS family arabinose efflux permease
MAEGFMALLGWRPTFMIFGGVGILWGIITKSRQHMQNRRVQL